MSELGTAAREELRYLPNFLDSNLTLERCAED